MTTRMLTAREHELIEKTLGIEIPDHALPATAASLRNLNAVAGPFASTMAATDEFQNRRILVIDDEAINVRLIQGETFGNSVPARDGKTLRNSRTTHATGKVKEFQ